MTGGVKVSPEVAQRFVEMWTRDRLSAKEIAERLTAEGVPRPGGIRASASGETWTRHAVCRVLESGVLAGELVPGRTEADRLNWRFAHLDAHIDRLIDARERARSRSERESKPQRPNVIEPEPPVDFTDEQLRWW